MYRGTTPVITFKLNTDIDLTQISELYITFKSMTTEVSITKNECEIDDINKTISIRLSQEQTLKFEAGVANVQIRLKVGTSRAYATSIKQIDIGRILRDGVI